MTIALAGYQTADLIYDGTRTLVYRGFKTDDSKPVVIKMLRKEYPTFNELLQFRHQYVLSKNLDLPGIIKPIALEKYGNGYVLAMEEVGGVSLSEYVGDRPLDIKEFLRIAIATTKVLEDLYRNRVIHKDIKPANILINPETKEIFLIDFSISSLLPRETQEIQNPNVIEGTLAYISPEQTGRMNRGIDYRSDFYSLGVTFYELLTGELPFKSEDPMELVHCHIAKTPLPPHEVKPEIPKALSLVAMKLMSKTAEERYQSALGIKNDLEKCLSQWQETGSIAEFKLGARDISDRFLIPEKLYGREKELQTLLDAFERVTGGNNEMMLVAGFSGIGKTAVINEVHKPIVRQRGYFIKGKFDQFNRNIPFSAFVRAFRDLMGQLLGESDTQLEEWKSKILSALGENAQVIIQVIPELEGIIGKQPAVVELSGSAAQNRFNLLFGKFITVFTAKEHPLVLFLDDLQWADSASLSLLKLLMGETETGYLLVLGAYRDNEVNPAHPLMLMLDEIVKNEAIVNTITLTSLTQSGLNYLIADTLSCSLELAFPLTKLVYQKTKGNPFFATQFIKALNEGEWISYNSQLGYWQCDMLSVRQLALTEDVVEFMAIQLQTLPQETQEVLKLAACIGDRFDLTTLAIVSERSLTNTATALWKALQEGLVLPTNEIYKFYQSEESHNFVSNSENQSPVYKFLHDRVQQASYSLIPQDEKQKTHLKIGRLLLNKTSIVKQEENIFEIVNHLNMGIELIDGPLELQKLARLNLIAGQKAKNSTAYVAADEYLTIGRQLLSENSWKSHYDLTLALYEEATEVAYLNADFNQMEQLIAVIEKSTFSVLDNIKALEIKMTAYTTRGHSLKAIQVALPILKALGVNLISSESQDSIELALKETKANLGEKQIQDLIDLPPMENSEIFAALRILLVLWPVAYQSKPELSPSILAKQVNLSIQYGNAAPSVIAYIAYGIFLIGAAGDLEAGYQFGKLGLELLERLKAKALAARALTLFQTFILPWKKHIRDNISSYLSAYSIGLETGDLLWASYAIKNFSLQGYFIGKNLDALKEEMKKTSEVIRSLHQNNALAHLEIPRQAVVALLGETKEPWMLKGDIYNENLPLYSENKSLEIVFQIHVHKLMLSYLFERYSDALENTLIAEQNSSSADTHFRFPSFYFYNSLVKLANCDREMTPESQRLFDEVISQQEKMQEWAHHAPMNFQHKYDLIEAEKHQVLGERIEAIELYDRAIAGAQKNDYTQEEALANERTAIFYLDWGKDKIAATYMTDAYYCYARWGAKAKVDDLEKRYPALLAPILERQKLALTAIATVASMANETLSKTTTGTGEMLDLASLMKASRTLSEEISVEGAIANLMKVTRENAGAETAALMLFEGEVLMLGALVRGEDAPSMDPIRVEASNEVPLSIINKVKRTQKPLVSDNASKDNAWAGDAYIRSSQPKSILCLPLVDRGKLIGILYLENNRVAGAFTSDRVEVITLLCSQAAISLENARLYRESQNYSQQLEQMQLQLVQSEKMATVGQLTAGVAHEINNPVGFISGNLTYTSDYFQDILELLNLYRETFPRPGEKIEEKIEAIELDYLIEDLPNTMDSMKEGIERITEISKSMRTFSRGDTAAKIPFNLHDGIDSTLLILKHRLKASVNRPSIEIVKNYGSLPEVNCYPGQLNQVFMNLIANAIDAFDEANVGRTFSEIKAAPNRITITTEIEKKVAIVKIKDNGMGMSREVKEKVFEHLFTTKGVGKGTGLGLSISRQIVEEKHGGKITVISAEGKGTEFAIAIPLS